MDKNRNNNQLFYKIWRNIYLKNEILFHLRLYNKYLKQSFYFSIYRIPNYKYKSYLNKIQLHSYKVNENEPIEPFLYSISEIKLSFQHLRISKFNESIPTSVNTFRIVWDIFSPLSNTTNISLPQSITFLEFGCNIEIVKHFIPNGVKTIIFTNGFDQPFTNGVLPSSVTSIDFGYSFNQSLKGDWIPTNIESIKFGDKFDQPYEDIKTFLPKSITSLILPKRYDLKSLSSSLALSSSSSSFSSSSSSSSSSSFSLPTSHSFNKNYQLLDSIPNSFKILIFNDSFDESIGENDIPNNVKSIIFGREFNKPIIENSLSINLVSIEFGCRFNQPIKLKTMINIESIKFGSFNQSLEYCEFPPNLTSLTFDGFNRPIPKGYFFNLGVSFDFNIDDNTLPTTLTSLDLGGSSYFNDCCKSLNQLESLKLGSKYGYPIKKGQLPNSIKKLIIGGYFNFQIEKDILPCNITYLSFGYSYSQPFLIGSLPGSLKRLYIQSDYFNQDFSLSFNDYFTSSLEAIYITQSSNLISILNSAFFSKYIQFHLIGNN
ncbi:hypothetical protein ACTA71_002450 [Dictyostelium dimigraforme]